MKVVEEDAFLVVESKAGKMLSGSEDEDETTEEVREKMRLAEKLKFTTDGFREIQRES